MPHKSWPQKSAHNVKLKWLKFHIEQYSPLQ
ncbi:Uncharacterised protein [Vibrio cholerae]|nr:Uncharacterised protein [Vibrio cholerae]